MSKKPKKLPKNMFYNIKFEKKGYNNVQHIEISLIFARDFLEFGPKRDQIFVK